MRPVRAVSDSFVGISMVVGIISGPHPILTKESLRTCGSGNKILSLLFGPILSCRSPWMTIKDLHSLQEDYLQRNGDRL